MRVSSSQTSSIMLQSIDHSSKEMGKLMTEMASGKRVLVPSDDPIASTRVIQLNREESAIDQYQDNITTASSSMAQQETMLGSVSDALLSVRDDLVQASNGTNNAEALNSFGTEIASLTASMVASLNYCDGDGHYMFSGTASDQETITMDENGNYVYNGNDEHRTATVSNGMEIDTNVSAGEMFFSGSDGSDIFNTLNDLANMLLDPNIDPSDPAVQDSISSAIDSVDQAIDQVSGGISQLGENQDTLEMVSGAETGISTTNQTVIGAMTNLDYATAATELDGLMGSVQATQATYAKISQLSLFSVI